jgi:hypothetical protein
MKYALLIFPKPGSHEALGPDEYGPVNAEYLALRRTRAASEAPTCNQPRRRPRFVIASVRR